MINQPRDPNHPIYKIIDEYLEKSDQKTIRMKLNVSQASVSLVKTGKSRSARIWKEIITIVKERKKNQDEFMKSMRQEAA